jgi:hypothetical protein
MNGILTIRPRVRKRLLCHHDYRPIRKELGSALPGRGLRLQLVAEVMRPAAELVLDCRDARRHVDQHAQEHAFSAAPPATRPWMRRVPRPDSACTFDMPAREF